MRQHSISCWLAACGWALLGSGCTFINSYDDPVLVGKWESPDPAVAGDNSTKNDMDAELDGGGDGTLFFSDGVANYSADNKLDWEQSADKEFVIRFKCSSTNFPGGCTDLTFDMECEADNSGDDLECKCEDADDCPYSADERWRWERD